MIAAFSLFLQLLFDSIFVLVAILLWNEVVVALEDGNKKKKSEDETQHKFNLFAVGPTLAVSMMLVVVLKVITKMKYVELKKILCHRNVFKRLTMCS